MDTLSNVSRLQFMDQTLSVIDPAFVVYDGTTNSQTNVAGQPYTGPVAGLVYQYIYTGSDNLNVTAGVANTFIHTGGGNDAIDVSHVGGTNVLDGGAGSNFLVGGTGYGSFDTFFVDDRSPPADIWSTVANFHAGDAATIFGISPKGFTTSWVDGQGATGYTGLTLHVTAPGVPTASITLAGYTTADLTNGELTTSFGTEADGTPYLYIQANPSASPTNSIDAANGQLLQYMASFGATAPGSTIGIGPLSTDPSGPLDLALPHVV
jgi:hypothetical protein